MRVWDESKIPETGLQLLGMGQCVEVEKSTMMGFDSKPAVEKLLRKKSLANVPYCGQKQPSEKKLFLKILQYSWENTCARVLCWKFLRTPILKNTCQQLLLCGHTLRLEWNLDSADPTENRNLENRIQNSGTKEIVALA